MNLRVSFIKLFSFKNTWFYYGILYMYVIILCLYSPCYLSHFYSTLMLIFFLSPNNPHLYFNIIYTLSLSIYINILTEFYSERKHNICLFLSLHKLLEVIQRGDEEQTEARCDRRVVCHVMKSGI